jgi:alpha-L-fucosidase
MLTRRDNCLYVHLNRDAIGNVVKLKPLNVAPVKATLLNDGRKVEYVVRFAPSDHNEQKAYLSLVNLPVNDLCNTVPVFKLEFDRTLDELVVPHISADGNSNWIDISW